MKTIPNEFKLSINVLESDIDEGIRFDCDNCPIARAVKRAFMDEFGPVDDLDSSVDGGGIKLFWYDEAHRLQVADGVQTDKCAEFIGWFDDGHVVQPFQEEISFSRILF